MKVSGLFLVLAAGSILISCGSQPNQTSAIRMTPKNVGIVGGSEVSSSDPIARTTVSIYDTATNALCTGSIYTDELIITAAHCVGNNLAKMYVIFSENLSSIDKSDLRLIVDAAIPSRWDARQNEDTDTGDIALLRISGGLAEGYQAVQLLPGKHLLRNNATVTLAGYGITDSANHEGAGVLRRTDVRIKQAQYNETEVLLDQTDGSGACHGDSGGPAFFESTGMYYLWGVTSRSDSDPGDTCQRYSVYTNILDYMDWIEEAQRAL
jgi:secreted trypsin-like serine protease